MFFLLLPYLSRADGIIPVRISITVVGQSFVGLQYVRKAELILTDSEYRVTYTCRVSEGFEYHCPCRRVEKRMESKELKRLFNALMGLVDEGKKATCCDHPWTEVEILYSDGSGKKLTVAFEPIEVEELLVIECRR